MKTSILMLAATLLAASEGARANTIVLPNGNAATQGNAATEGILGDGLPVQFEWQISQSDLSSVVGATFTSIGFRLTRGQSQAAISIPSWDLELGKGTNPIGSLSTDLAANIAPGGVTVYNSALNIAAGSFVGGGAVNPFYFINFTTPYTYTGGDLIFYLQQAGAASVYLDGEAPGADGDTAASGGGSGVFTEVYYYPTTALTFSSPAPEPGTLFTLGIGIVVLVGRSWRRRLPRRP